MLNRKNLTLSALSNRLNLGTRSLVLKTSVNGGNQAQSICWLHHDQDVMRDRMVWYGVSSFTTEHYDIPPIPDSIVPGMPQRPIRCGSQDASGSACPETAESESGPGQTWIVIQASPGRRKAGRSLTSRKSGSARLAAGKRQSGRRARSAENEAAATAARQAAAEASAAYAAEARS